MKSGVPASRRPIPLARSIRWVPAAMFTPPRTIDDLALFVTQGVLRDVTRHLRAEPGRELLGFLLGELYECPESGARYLVIDAVLPTEYPARDRELTQIPEAEWLNAQLEAEHRQARLLGWYRGASFVGAYPDRHDLAMHRARFADRWPCGLVVVATAANAPAGGFFRPHLGEATAAGVFLPFYELLDDDALLEGGQKRTVLDWANYRTQDLVVREPRTQTTTVPPPPLAEPRAQVEHRAAQPEPARRPTSPPPPPRASAPAESPIAAPTDAGSAPPSLLLPSPGELEAMLAAASPPRRRPRAVLVAGALVGVATVIAAGFFWYRGGVAEIPGGVATGELAPRTIAHAPSVSPVSPLNDAAPAPALSTPLPHATSTGTGAPTSAAPPSTSPLALHFDVLADTLEQAMRNFRDRGTDFALNRIACDGLAVGYRSADVAFMALASAHRATRDALDSARETRYQKLEGQMRQVNEEFDSTKCPRP